MRNKFPNAHISLVSHPQMEHLFSRFNHYIDEFIPFKGFPGMPESAEDPEHVLRTIRQIQQKNYDLAVQLHGSGELSNSVISLFNAKTSLGYYRPGFYRPTELYQAYPDELHEVERCLKILEQIGVDTTDTQLEFPLDEKDSKVLEDSFPELMHLLERPFICLHPGASTESKRWPASNFAQIGDWLYEKGFNVVFTGSKVESEVVRLIQSLMKYQSFDAATYNLDLPHLAALIAKSSGVICNDTGVSHLSAALKIPSIVIFIETSPERWAPQNIHLHKWLWRPKVLDVQNLATQFLTEEFVS